MTKAEIKKLETEKKYDFITKVYDIVLRCVPAETRAYRKKVEVRIVHQNFNRYIRFCGYGKNLAFQIFGDGNIAIELREAMHSTHTEQLFEYDADTEKQDAFLAEFEEIAPALVKVFIERDIHDFHSYMDYVSSDTTAYAAYQKMHNEYNGIFDE